MVAEKTEVTSSFGQDHLCNGRYNFRSSCDHFFSGRYHICSDICRFLFCWLTPVFNFLVAEIIFKEPVITSSVVKISFSGG